MLPKQYRKRYGLIFLISFLLHLALMLYLLWNPISVEPPEKEKTTVEIKLKKEEPKKSEPKKDEPKKDEPKKDEPKKDEPKKSEPKKSEPKKSEPKKSEPKKSEPKKSEPKKSEPKKSEPKKSEPKKSEPKKSEPKKSEPKKSEPKKAEPKKAEPKKAEPKKAEPKKAEPKKSEPKKSEPKKSEPRKSQSEISQGGAGASKGTQDTTRQPPSKPTKPAKGKPKQDNELNTLAYWTKKMGSMAQLDDKNMRKAVVFSSGDNRQFRQREEKGMRALRALNVEEKMEHDQKYAEAAKQIMSNYQAPPNDGKKYYGEIRFIIDRQGYITDVNFKQRSGNAALDEAMRQALIAVKRFSLPSNPKAAMAFIELPKKLFYDERDLAR